MRRINRLVALTLAVISASALSQVALADPPPSPPPKNIFDFGNDVRTGGRVPATIQDSFKQIDRAILKDDYDAAVKTAESTDAAARILNDARLADLTAKRLASVRLLRDEAAKAAPAIEKVGKSADDQQANLAAGRFYCFWRGDWEKGLPLLAKSADDGLRAVAQEELAASVDPAVQFGVANTWWDMAGKLDEPAKLYAQDHACELYLKVVGALTGFNRTTAQQRIAQAPTHLPYPRPAVAAPLNPGEPFASQVRIVADDFVCDIYHNGKLVASDQRKLTDEVYGAQVEIVTLDLKPGDWVVFNVVNNRLRWGGAYYFAAAGLTDTGGLAFASDLRSGNWSACDDLKEVAKFIADRDYLKDHSPKAVDRPWDQGDKRIRKGNPDWDGQAIWGDPQSRSTWLKYVVPGGADKPTK